MVLSQMISSLRTVPLPSFYSFDLLNGVPFQPSAMRLPLSQRVMWNPFNPFYDPGPPPERRERPEQSGSSGTASTSAPAPGYGGVARGRAQSSGKKKYKGKRGDVQSTAGFRDGRLLRQGGQQSENHASLN